MKQGQFSLCIPSQRHTLVHVQIQSWYKSNTPPLLHPELFRGVGTQLLGGWNKDLLEGKPCPLLGIWAWATPMASFLLHSYPLLP